ncbi:MAG: hypothetical protein AAGA91_15950 [Pseudomonadota bacterium]
MKWHGAERQMHGWVRQRGVQRAEGLDLARFGVDRPRYECGVQQSFDCDLPSP